MGKMRSGAFGVSLFVGALTAHAATVEVVVDVTPTSRYTTRWLPGNVETTLDASFQPQAFQWLISLDLDQATVNAATTNLTVQDMSASILFKGVDIPASPYTDGFHDLLPLQDAQLAVNTGQVSATLTKPLSKPPLYLPYAMSSYVSIGTGQSWSVDEAEGGIATRSYGRNFRFRTEGPTMSNEAFHAWTPQEFVDFLSSQIGKTQKNRFSEGVSYELMQPNAAPGTIVAYTFQGPLTVEESTNVIGDATIRSVSIVPEPASWLSMSLGLIGMACLARKRQVSAK